MKTASKLALVAIITLSAAMLAAPSRVPAAADVIWSGVKNGAERVAEHRGPGYVIRVPSTWKVEVRGPLAVSFEVPGRMVLDIYTQPLGKKSVEEYIGYSNKYLEQGVAGIRILYDSRRGEAPSQASPRGMERWWQRGRDCCLAGEMSWSRPELFTGDFNHYHQVHVVKGRTVYSFILRTTGADFDAYRKEATRAAISLRTVPLDLPVPPVPAEVENLPLPDANAIIAGKYVGERMLDVRVPDEGLVWGMFDGNAPYDLTPLREKEQVLGHRFDLVMTYRDFTKPFPLKEVREAAREGRLAMITWQPWHEGKLTDPLLIPEIIAGEYDGHIREWARAVRDFGQPLFLRFANEMNGDWDPWSVFFYGFDHSLYVRAWRRVHGIFAAEGATNAMWVWNPHDRSYPNFTWNDPHLYYPGDDYVDWVGLTGYNTGPRAGDPWRSFDEIYGRIYAEYRLRYPEKPLMITEFASDEQGGDKAAWIRDAFQALKRYPAIKYAVWFDFPWWNWEYPLRSSEEAFRAFGEAAQDPYFRSDTVRWREEEQSDDARRRDGAQRPDAVTVLAYHHLVPAELGLHKQNPAVLPVEEFRAQMERLKHEGYDTVTPEEVAAFLRDEGEIPERSVMITFDDGYQSFYHYAFPILEELGLKATVFVIGSAVPAEPAPFDPERLTYLSWPELRELAGSGLVSVQSHTYAGHRLDENGVPVPVGWDGEAASADAETIAGLFSANGLPQPIAVAYPYGAIPRDPDAWRRAGYSLGFAGDFTSQPGRAGDERLRIGRHVVLPGRGISVLSRLLGNVTY